MRSNPHGGMGHSRAWGRLVGGEFPLSFYWIFNSECKELGAINSFCVGVDKGIGVWYNIVRKCGGGVASGRGVQRVEE